MAPEAETSEQQEENETSREAEERAAPAGAVVYKAILSEGEDELQRSTSALFWSGLAAGLSMGFSLITEGLLRHHLPEAPWELLVSKFGYSIGFLIVVLGRQQLFTENTLTPILPLLTHRTADVLMNVARLWGVVFIANMIGTMLVAQVLAHTSVLEPAVRETLVNIGREALNHPFGTTLWRAIFAGWLIALMVWLLPFAEAARFFVIIVITYVIGIGHFSHVIAGSIDVFLVAATGNAGYFHVIWHFIVPALIGNIIGGVMLVAAINHAQVVAGKKGKDA
jgi:formate/nitrite transporter FocA (FNT family)